MTPDRTSQGAGEMASIEASDASDFRRIVVALDGSSLAEQALPYAEALALLMEAPLHIVRVIDPTHLGTPLGVLLATDALTSEMLLDDERLAARDYLERIQQDLRGRQHDVTIECRQGPAADELLAVIEPGDLLVMTTHGRSGPARWFLGSVAEAMVRRATVPIFMVRTDESVPTSPAIRRIIVPLDGSALAEEALPTAGALARRLRVPVLLLNVIDLSEGEVAELALASVSPSRLGETLVRLYTEAESHLAHACDRLQQLDQEPSTEVRHGLPAEVIVGTTEPGDLIVMTSHGRTGLPRLLLGSVAEAVMRRSAVPVLLMRTKPSVPVNSADTSAN